MGAVPFDLTRMRVECRAMRPFAALMVLFAASLGMSAEGNNSCPDGPHTLYSKRAMSLDSGSERIKSPDGKKLLTVKTIQDQMDPDGMHLSFTMDVARKEFSTELPGFNAEVLWSPDSTAFAVTQTEGGGGIGYRAYVFYVGENGFNKVDVSDVVVKAFGTQVKCEVPVPPNTGFVDWLDGSHRILVAAEVVPVSICHCSGTFKLYELSVPKVRILHAYSQIEAKQRFSNLLGCELHDADDKCTENSRRN